jgi:hypothetical protein
MGDKSIKNKNVKKKKKVVATAIIPSIIVSSDWTQTQPELIRKKKKVKEN